MKKYFWQTKAFTFLTIVIIGTSCSGQIRKDLSKGNASELEIVSANQQIFIKTQSTNTGDNVNSSIQDKEGNLWFGTTADGIYNYDGKLFTQFTAVNPLLLRGRLETPAKTHWQQMATNGNQWGAILSLHSEGSRR